KECTNGVAGSGVRATTADVDRCASAVERQSCAAAADLPVPRECTTLGDRPLGARCFHAYQCATGVCARFDASGCGTCAVLAAEGAPCGDGCDFGLVCSGGVCVSPRALAAPCDDAHPCSTQYQCSVSRCAPYAQRGENCTGSNLCDPRRSLYCDTNNSTCAPLTYSAPGGPCGIVAGGVAACAGGICFAASGIQSCIAFKKLGESCNNGGPTPQPCMVPGRCIAGQCALASDSLCR